MPRCKEYARGAYGVCFTVAGPVSKPQGVFLSSKSLIFRRVSVVIAGVWVVEPRGKWSMKLKTHAAAGGGRQGVAKRTRCSRDNLASGKSVISSCLHAFLSNKSTKLPKGSRILFYQEQRIQN